MLTRLLNWLDHRAAVRQIVGALLLEGIPGGARWRYVWGSCLAFVFSLQLITGILLMTAYSPSSSQAWSSVHFIQYQMDFGWLIRGLHHFGSQTMMVLIGLHMLQVVIAGAHLPPREINWWLGIGLLSVTLGLSLTGYLLPWDQKGYWATRVATNIAGTLPEVGQEVRQQAVGGPDYSSHTLTRFFALHVAVLPGALILLMIAHIVIFRRHGVTCPDNVEGTVTAPANAHAPGSEMFWPRQAFYDLMACMGVFTVMLGLVLYGFAHKVEPPPAEEGVEPGLYEKIAHAGQDGKGAELDAAADRDTADYPARPEWYFLALFQLLKYFKGDDAIIGTVIIPNGVMLLLTLLPLFGIGPLRKFGHYFGVLVVVALLILDGMLTTKALMDDSSTGLRIPYAAIPTLLLIVLCYIGPLRDRLGTLGKWIVALLLVLCGAATIYLFTIDKKDRPFSFTLQNSDPDALKAAKGQEEHVEEAESKAERACQLAMAGAPVAGGHMLIRNDPFTSGRKQFEVKCAGCHSFTAQEGDKFKSMTDGKTASDLGNFGSKEWVRGLLKNPAADHYFGLIKRDELDAEDKTVKDDKGNVKKVEGFTRMKKWREDIDKARKDGKVDAAAQDKDFDKIAAWLAYVGKTPKELRKDDALIEAGQLAFADKKNRCSSCHAVEMRVKDEKTGKFEWEKEDNPGAPDLTDHGSAAWIRGMIMRPGHKSRYGERNLMPAFRPKDGVGAEIGLGEFRETNEKTPDNMILDLSDLDREMIIRWILRDYRPVYGGTPISK